MRTSSSSPSAAARHGPTSGTEGEGSDTANKDLPPQQVELIDAVTALGKPTVAVVSIGGPYALASVSDKLPAVITDYYGGPYQATAIADAIFGVTNPGGKLPFTLPRHVGQMPIHCAQKWGSGYRRTDSDIHKGYLDMPSTPLFAFGHGLSYTTFEYEPLTLASETVDVNGEARVSLTVTNTGKLHGTESQPGIRGDLRGLQDAEAHAEAQRTVVSRGVPAQRGRVRRTPARVRSANGRMQ